MATNPYNTPDFNADEYVALYPDLAAWWAGTVPGSERVKAEWNGNRAAWALDHWTTHGKAEGRQGRTSVYSAAQTTSAGASTGTKAAPASSSSAGVPWLLVIAALGVGWYLYDQQKKSRES